MAIVTSISRVGNTADFNINAVDSDYPSGTVTINVYEENGLTPVDDTSGLAQGANFTVEINTIGTYKVDVFITDGGSPVSFLDEMISFNVEGVAPELTLGTVALPDIDTSYTFTPTAFVLNNNTCPLFNSNEVDFSYNIYEIINGIRVLNNDVSDSINLSGWTDGVTLLSYVEITFNTENNYPLIIVVTATNCYASVTKEIILPYNDAVSIHSEEQIPGTYQERFNYAYQGEVPTLIIGADSDARADIIVLVNDVVVKTFTNVFPTEFKSYNFNKPSDLGNEYTVRYKAYNIRTAQELTQEYTFTVLEWKPTFELEEVTCFSINQNATFGFAELNINCYQDYEDVQLSLQDTTINYEYFYFNTETYEWDAIDDYTYNPEEDIADFIDANPTCTDVDISEYLFDNARFGTANLGGLWKPNKLTMVKMVVTVTNHSTSVTKERIFPICGTWKIRRLACGNYRIYNYKSTSISYTLTDNYTNTVIKNQQVPAFSYLEIVLSADGVYKVQADGLVQYIFNFCALEQCILNLQKDILLDECFCDSCKRNKDLYQKAMRMLPLYETWKKLLDKDGVYNMQYKTTDIAGELARIYDAQELYLELSKLCESCGNISKKCGC
jgi:hypothetical protein